MSGLLTFSGEEVYTGQLFIYWSLKIVYTVLSES